MNESMEKAAREAEGKSGSGGSGVGKFLKSVKDDVKALAGDVKALADTVDFDSGAELHSFAEYLNDFLHAERVNCNLAIQEHAMAMLKTSRQLYKLYVLMNEQREQEICKMFQTDFYSITKVDGHVHASSSFDINYFLEYMQEVVNSKPNEPVYYLDDGTKMTFKVRVARVEGRVAREEGRVAREEARVGRVEARVARVEARVARVEGRG